MAAFGLRQAARNRREGKRRADAPWPCSGSPVQHRRGTCRRAGAYSVPAAGLSKAQVARLLAEENTRRLLRVGHETLRCALEPTRLGQACFERARYASLCFRPWRLARCVSTRSSGMSFMCWGCAPIASLLGACPGARHAPCSLLAPACQQAHRARPAWQGRPGRRRCGGPVLCREAAERRGARRARRAAGPPGGRAGDRRCLRPAGCACAKSRPAPGATGVARVPLAQQERQ